MAKHVAKIEISCDHCKYKTTKQHLLIKHNKKHHHHIIDKENDSGFINNGGIVIDNQHVHHNELNTFNDAGTQTNSDEIRNPESDNEFNFHEIEGINDENRNVGIDKDFNDLFNGIEDITDVNRNVETDFDDLLKEISEVNRNVEKDEFNDLFDGIENISDFNGNIKNDLLEGIEQMSEVKKTNGFVQMFNDLEEFDFDIDRIDYDLDEMAFDEGKEQGNENEICVVKPDNNEIKTDFNCNESEVCFEKLDTIISSGRADINVTKIVIPNPLFPKTAKLLLIKIGSIEDDHKPQCEANLEKMDYGEKIENFSMGCNNLVECDLCTTRVQKRWLKSHKEKVHGVPVQCKKCNTIFLDKHSYIVHTPCSAKWNCPHCDQTFVRAADLENHKSKHDDDKKADC